MEKAVISARVPMQFKKELSNYCQAKGMTISAYIQQMFETLDSNSFLPAVDSVKVDKETRGILASLGGGGAVAVLVYKGTMAILTDKYPLMDKTEMKAYSVGAAGVVGILAGLGIHKIFN